MKIKIPATLFTLLLTLICAQNTTAQTVPFRVKSQWGLSDLSGKLLSKVQYDSIELVSRLSSNILVWKNKKVGVIDPKGKWGAFCHRNSVMYRYTDTTTYNLIPFEYDSIVRDPNSSFYLVRKNNLIGAVSTRTYQLVAQPKYKSISATYNDFNTYEVSTLEDNPLPKIIFSVITTDNKFGYVNAAGFEYFKD
jgi:hypothetical protein